MRPERAANPNPAFSSREVAKEENAYAAFDHGCPIHDCALKSPEDRSLGSGVCRLMHTISQEEPAAK